MPTGKVLLSESYVRSVLEKLDFDVTPWKSWKRKWMDLRGNATRRGYSCLLSFRQYMLLVKKAGITELDQIGRASDKFQMGRVGDTGNYEWGNCRFILARQNLDERSENGGNTQTSRKLARRFRIDSPKDNTYIGQNLRAFCKEYGLDYSCMKQVCGGTKDHYMGWSGRYEARF